MHGRRGLHGIIEFILLSCAAARTFIAAQIEILRMLACLHVKYPGFPRVEVEIEENWSGYRTSPRGGG